MRCLFIRLLLITALAESAVTGQVTLPSVAAEQPVQISTQDSQRWQEGEVEVLWLRGGCEIQQGQRRLRGSGGIVWIQRAESYRLSPHRLTIYLEDVVIQHLDDQGQPSSRLESQAWLGESAHIP